MQTKLIVLLPHNFHSFLVGWSYTVQCDTPMDGFSERCTSETNTELSNGGRTWKDALVDLVVRHQNLDKLLQEVLIFFG